MRRRSSSALRSSTVPPSAKACSTRPDRGGRRERELLEAILDATPTGRNDFEGFATKRIYRLFAKTRAFDALATDPVLLAVVDGLRRAGAAQRADGHPDRSWRAGAGAAPRRQHLPDAPSPHPDVVLNTMWAFDDFTVGQRRHPVRARARHRWAPGPDAGRRRGGGRRRDARRAASPSTPAAIWHGGGANAHRPSTSGRDPGVRGRLAAAPGEPRHRAFRPGGRRHPSRGGSRNCSATTSYPPFMGYVDGRHPRRYLPGGDLAAEGTDSSGHRP